MRLRDFTKRALELMAEVERDENTLDEVLTKLTELEERYRENMAEQRRHKGRWAEKILGKYLVEADMQRVSEAEPLLEAGEGMT